MQMNKYIENIKEYLSFNGKVRRKMVKRYEVAQYSNTILEKWLTDRTLNGAPRREELKSKRAEIAETALFIEFLKKVR